jgi:hypothetical protein
MAMALAITRARREPKVRARPLAWALLVLTILVASGASSQEPPAPPPTSSSPFEGSWSGTGSTEVLLIGLGLRALTFHLSGSLVLTTQEGLDRGYRCIVIGFDDGRGSSVGTCVWIDERGDKIFSDLKGRAMGTGQHFRGTITGGSGRYLGLRGGYEFDWSYVIQTPDGTLQGRVEKLTGSVVRSPSPSAKGSP